MVQKWIQSFILSLLLFSIIPPSTGLAQYLIKTKRNNLRSIDDVSFKWKCRKGDILIAMVPALKQVKQSGLDFEILDNDVETGTFYWVETRFGTPLQVNEISESKILWHDQNTALVRTRSNSFLTNLPRGYMGKFITFQSVPEPAPDTMPPVNLNSVNRFSSTVQTILDSVNIDQIYQTERHLTGEEPFWNGSQKDSIMTRYSYSGDIFKAENYIKNRFENLGLAVDLQSFSASTFYDVQFAPDQNNYGWVVSVDRIYGTNNQGQTWSTQFEGTGGATLWSVFPINHQTVYAVGGGGLILKSSNGSTWQGQVSPTTSYLFGVYFRNDKLGWICGDSGIILKTTDGGNNWFVKNTPTSKRLYDIFFVDDNNGWAVGRGGTILHTTNGGNGWAIQNSGIITRLYGVHFLSNSTGYAVGWEGNVLRTDDGGVRWFNVSLPISTYFYDIDFVNQTNGIIAGWGGTCLVTDDGGISWYAGGNIFQRDIYGLDLVNTSLVWATGRKIVARSNDLGTSWTQIQNLPDRYLKNIVASKEGTTHPEQYYIMCAHYDDTSQIPLDRAPGADDNGSGTATVLEAARVLSEYNFKNSIKFILFSAEEQGLIGSHAYAEAAALNGDQILGAINLDMIGFDGNGDGSMEIHGGNMASSQTIANFVHANISNWGLSLIPELKTSNSSTASDHSSFWSMGFPAIMIIEDFSDFTPSYHTVDDLLSTLRPSYFLDNARLTIGSLALLAEIDSINTSVSTNETIPTDFILYDPYPNPFNPAVNIEYELPSSNKVVVEIYNLLGQRLKQLVNQHERRGLHRITWDGTTDRGEFAASGLYFVRTHYSDQTQIKKIILIR